MNDLTAWRALREQGEEFETPSGLVVKLRKVSLMDLAEQGKIPAPLAGMVNLMLSTKPHALTVAEVPQYTDAINVVVQAAVVSPPLADAPGPGALTITELPFGDRLAIYNWANTGAALRPFRREFTESQGA